LHYCQANNIGVIVRGPLAKGILSGKFNPQTRFTDSVRQRFNSGEAREKFLLQLALVEKLRFLDQPGRNLAQAALQFVISHPAVSVAIPGAKDADQARSNARAGQRILDETQMAQINAFAPL
jgi:aryl-alcohol dehydrogenase-like predicted oxidoreductase